MPYKLEQIEWQKKHLVNKIKEEIKEKGREAKEVKKLKRRLVALKEPSETLYIADLSTNSFNSSHLLSSFEKFDVID